MGLANAEGQCLAAAIQDKTALIALPSKCEDGNLPKDRERQRPTVGQTRPSLGAVGRVASRVRTSGISKISTFLPRNKEGDEEVNASPWGVGTAATISRSQSTSVLPDISKSNSNSAYSKVSPTVKKTSDILEMSSPISTDGIEPMKSPKQTEDRSKGLIVANSAKLLDRQSSNALVKCKFTFRPSMSIDSKPPERVSVDEKRIEKLNSGGVRFNIPKELEGEPKGIDDKNISASSPVIIFQGRDDEKTVSSPKVTFMPERSGAEGPRGRLDPARDTEKSRILKFAFGKGKSRNENTRRKTKAEKSHGSSALYRSRSQGLKTSLGAVDDSEQTVALAPRRQSVGNGKTNGWFSKQTSVGGAKGRWSGGWFGFLGGDNGRGKQLNAAQKDRRKVHKAYTRRSSIGPDFFAKAAAKKDMDMVKASRIELLEGKKADTPKSGKPFETVDVVASIDFMIDEDEEVAMEAPIRSLAVDDFISYQTRKGKKSAKDK